MRWSIGMTAAISIWACAKQPPASDERPVPTAPTTTTTQARAEQPAVSGSPTSSPKPARYLVPSAEAAKFYVGHYEGAAGYFEPSEIDVNAFEAKLKDFLQTASDPRARGVLAKLESYRRQFVGVVVANNRLIFGNFYCSDKPVTTPVIVDDGGDCYFQIFYDPKATTFSKLSINGEG